MMEFIFTKTPLAYFVSSFWRDEAFSYLMARLPLHTLLWSTAQDANPPLYYLLLKIWMGIFGTSEVALRSVSLIFFWATIYIVFLILKNIYLLSAKKSLLYLGLFIVNPLLHYYAFEARMYSMIAFLGTLLFYFLLKKQYRYYAFTALAALYTHYFLIVVIASQMIYIYSSATHKAERSLFFTLLLKSFVWYIPWLIILICARPPAAGSFWIIASTWRTFFLLPAIIYTGYDQGSWIVISFMSLISLLVMGIVTLGVTSRWKQRNKLHFILILGWALGIPLVVFLISFLKPVFLPRYIIFSTVGMLILLILCFEGIKNKYIRYGFIAVMILLSLRYSSIQIEMRKKAPLKKIFYSIQSEMGKNDVLYVTHEYDLQPAQYYLPSKKVYLYKKTYEELPWYVGKILMSKSMFIDTLPQYPARAFILNNDGTYTIQSVQ